MGRSGADLPQRLERAAGHVRRGRARTRSPSASSRRTSTAAWRRASTRRATRSHAETREVVNSELEPGAEEIVQHGGQEGFTVDYWRKVWRGDDADPRRAVHPQVPPRGHHHREGPRAGEADRRTRPAPTRRSPAARARPSPGRRRAARTRRPASRPRRRRRRPRASRRRPGRRPEPRADATPDGYSSFRVAVPVASIDSIEPWKSSVVPISSSLPPSSGRVTCCSSASVARVSARSKVPPLTMSVV